MLAKDAVKEAKDAINELMQGEFEVKDIPEIAQMIQNVQTLECYMQNADKPGKSNVIKLQSADGDDVDHLEDINRKLDDADRYYDRWIKTKIEGYKDIAVQDLSHSEFFIGLARKSGKYSAEDLEDCIVHHNATLARLT